MQQGDTLFMPHSRPMPSIGPGCHELRIKDAKAKKEWRIVYRADTDAIVIASVFQKTTEQTPQREIDLARKRFSDFDAI